MTDIRNIPDTMEYDNLTEAQLDLVVDLEKQFLNKGTLTEKQCDLLEDIHHQAWKKANS